MSLYYEAAALLTNPDKAGGSLKSRIYKKDDLKSSPAQIFALISEAAKWSAVLKDVIEKSGVLAEEKKACAYGNSSIEIVLTLGSSSHPSSLCS
jgi:putative methyltransferase